MRKKDIVFYVLILILVVLFLWQWLSKGALISQLSKAQNHNSQLQLLSGIGPLASTHIHADVKVYINSQSIDFSQRKYQLATSFIHFEEGIGDVVHVHATGMTMGHLFKSLKGDISNNCVALEKQNYCNENENKLKFYVNGKLNNEFSTYVIHDLDRILVSYGSENEAEIQNQLGSITNLAPRYSAEG
ncbi:hypothetical protein HYX05_00860 [Candidatus Woesearchaeota archaeon]|nr:hypothetical protein [Candidatus Woesearchaeota archaeon]